ncbi:MAG: DNA repair exonuclease [Acidimicrobiia bacterium]|nr:DNA repair exonuclease [Acidimicrobiia bacterium]
MKFRFVHAADLHLDTPFSGIREAAPEVSDALRRASLDAFVGLVDLAIDREAAFVVLAGDIYDGAERGVAAQLRFQRGLKRLDDNGIYSFIVHGNHDPVKVGWSAIRDWPDLVTVFGHKHVDQVTVEWRGEQIATVHGISYEKREQTENLALRFRRGSGPGIHVGVLHANAGNNQDHDPYAPCSVDDLAIADLDYWALGHIHKRQILRHGDPWIVYPGNLQGRSPKPSEMGEKGAYVVEVDGTTIAEPEFVALDKIRFREMELDVFGMDLSEVEGELLKMGDQAIADGDGRSLLVRCSLRGSGDIHEDLARMGAVEELLTELREESTGQDPFLWWESLRDRTTTAIDIDAIRERGDFSAELLALADELSAEGDGGFVDDVVEHLPLTKLERLGVELPSPEDPVLWNDAVTLAIELLEGGAT